MVALFIGCGLGLCILSSPVFIFIFMSLQSLLFLFLISSGTDVKLAVSYYVPALAGGTLWLVGSLSFEGSCLLTFIGLCLKLGLFPFHGWAVLVRSGLCQRHLFIFMGPLKLGLLFLLLFGSCSFALHSFFCFLTGLYYLYRSLSWGILLFRSSLVTFPLYTLMRSGLFFIFVFVYVITLYLVCSPDWESRSMLGPIISLGGIAPFPLFWVKLYLLSVLPSSSGVLVLLILGFSAPGYLSYFALVNSRGKANPYSFFYANLFLLGCLLPLVV